MPPRRISTKLKAGPPRAKRPEARKDKDNKKKKPRPGEGGRTLFVTIACAAGASILGVALSSLLHSLAATKRAKDALSRAASNPLYFTQHARERMQCRRVSERQVHEALRSGRVISKKSEVDGVAGRKSGGSFGGVCDKLVVDADIPGDENGEEPFKALQAVFKACPSDTGVITVIDRVRFSPLFSSFFSLLFLSLCLLSLLTSFPLSSPQPNEPKNRLQTGTARADLLLNSDL